MASSRTPRRKLQPSAQILLLALGSLKISCVYSPRGGQTRQAHQLIGKTPVARISWQLQCVVQGLLRTMPETTNHPKPFPRNRNRLDPWGSASQQITRLSSCSARVLQVFRPIRSRSCLSQVLASAAGGTAPQKGFGGFRTSGVAGSLCEWPCARRSARVCLPHLPVI